MQRSVNILFCLLFLFFSSCCVVRLNTKSQHHEIYDCGFKKTFIYSSAIKEISIKTEPSLSKILRPLSRKYEFDEIEFVITFEINQNSSLEIMNVFYTAYSDSIQLFTNKTINKSIEKFNRSILSADYDLLESEFGAGLIYSIRFTYKP